jgi:hypothetical protein
LLFFLIFYKSLNASVIGFLTGSRKETARNLVVLAVVGNTFTAFMTLFAGVGTGTWQTV